MEWSYVGVVNEVELCGVNGVELCVGEWSGAMWGGEWSGAMWG